MSSLEKKFEDLLLEFHKENYQFLSDHLESNRRVVQLKKYTLNVVLIQTDQISFDIFADLNAGVYELGELHSLTTRMLNVKKLCLEYNCREMNTTERLYPADRRGKQTQTSGL